MQDLEIGEQRIAEGDLVMLVLGAANRDPAQFSDPERLNIGRRSNRHIAFGAGSHLCVGAPLARLQARIVFPTLLRRARDIQLDTEALEWRVSPSIRSLRALPVTLTPA